MKLIFIIAFTALSSIISHPLKLSLPPECSKSPSPEIYPLISKFESLKLKVYNDYGYPAKRLKNGKYEVPRKGFLTIGIGHLLTKKEISRGTMLIGTKYLDYTNGITTDQARVILDQDMKHAIDTVNKNVTTCINQNQFNALTSFIFNLGPSGFYSKGEQNKLITELNRKNDYQVYIEIQRFAYSGGRLMNGLVFRRRAEADLFYFGDTAYWR